MEDGDTLEAAAIEDISCSGKTTLLNVIGGPRLPDRGHDWVGSVALAPPLSARRIRTMDVPPTLRVME